MDRPVLQSSCVRAQYRVKHTELRVICHYDDEWKRPDGWVIIAHKSSQSWLQSEGLTDVVFPSLHAVRTALQHVEHDPPVVTTRHYIRVTVEGQQYALKWDSEGSYTFVNSYKGTSDIVFLVKNSSGQYNTILRRRERETSIGQYRTLREGVAAYHCRCLPVHQRLRRRFGWHKKETV